MPLRCNASRDARAVQQSSPPHEPETRERTCGIAARPEFSRRCARARVRDRSEVLWLCSGAGEGRSTPMMSGRPPLSGSRESTMSGIEPSESNRASFVGGTVKVVVLGYLCFGTSHCLNTFGCAEAD